MSRGKRNTGPRFMVMADTSFLIALANPEDACHTSARQWHDYFCRRNIQLLLSTIVMAEFFVRQNDLAEMSDYPAIDYTFEHAQITGEFAAAFELRAKETGNPPAERVAIKDDLKIIAQAACERVTHIITADARTFIKAMTFINDRFGKNLIDINLNLPFHPGAAFGELDFHEGESSEPNSSLGQS